MAGLKDRADRDGELFATMTAFAQSGPRLFQVVYPISRATVRTSRAIRPDYLFQFLPRCGFVMEVFFAQYAHYPPTIWVYYVNHIW